MAEEEETMRFLGGVTGPNAAWRMMASITGSWTLLGYSMFSVIERASGRWIGRLGPWQPGGETGDWPGPEVGWGLIADAQGKGYALEGATAAMDYAFGELGWPEVIHCIAEDNAPSIRLAEKLGARFQRRGVPLPHTDALVDVYGQTREEWRARSGR